MHDFKHLDSQRRFSLSAFFRKRKNSNQLLPLEPEFEAKTRRLKIALPVIACLLAGYPAYSLMSGKVRPSLAQKNSPAPQAVVDTLPSDPYRSFQMAADCFRSAHLDGGHYVSGVPGGGTMVYAIDPSLQERVKKVMAENRVPFGVFVAIEPKTGRILALASHSSIDPRWEERSFYSVYPMASLFKIVTAAAAFEQKKVSPQTVVAFNGKHTSENPRYWYVKPGHRAQEMNLCLAMGKSVNPVFGRLASDWVGKDSMMTYAGRFGFNQTLFPGTAVQPSCAMEPRDDQELKLMGAGLGREVKVSPLHVAAMMGAIANNGTMMVPILAEEMRNAQGNVVAAEKPMALRRLVAPETCRELAQTLSTSVTSGTSRRAFHDRRGRPMLASINVAAKTGSITGHDPQGFYNWFAAYAPAENPQIALVALVINRDKWRIKASQLGEKALEEFFK